MPVTMDAAKRTMQQIVEASERLDASRFPGIRFSIKNVNYGFVECFFKQLKEKKSITTLQLFGNPSEHRAIPYPILLNEKIETLHLDGMQFTDKSFKALIFQINEMKTLKHLNLSGMNINKTKAKLIGFMLTKNETLLSLNLGYNNINDDCAHEIVRGLKANKTLREIDFQNNQINRVEDWGEVLQENTTLKSMNLAANNIVSTFFVPSGLEMLILSSNTLDYNNLGRLLESLIFHDSKLKHLNLSNNPIHELLRFDDVLKNNPQLEELMIANIGIYDKNLKVIHEALKESNIRVLGLKSNNLTDHGMSQFHKLVKENTKIQHLDLRYNCVEIDRPAIELENLTTLC